MSEPILEVLTAAESGVIAAIGKAVDAAIRDAEQRGRRAGFAECREACIGIVQKNLTYIEYPIRLVEAFTALTPLTKETTNEANARKPLD